MLITQSIWRLCAAGVCLPTTLTAGAPCLLCVPRCCRRYFTCALKHAQELAEQVKITSKRDRAGTVEMQEQVRLAAY